MQTDRTRSRFSPILRRGPLFLSSVLLIVGGLATPLRATDGDLPDFDRDVQPILARHCLLCHGFDPSSRKAKLRLDTFEGATAVRGWGRRAIVPGDRHASVAFRKLTAEGEARMPPPERDGLTDEEIEILGAWIDGGATYDPPWAWRPIEDPPPPAVENTDWPRDPLDHFVLARMEKADVAPAPEGSPESWLRRVSFDLTGLPPSPEERQAFLTDALLDLDAARATAVDRLLASQHFGEQWGRHWLDLMRYAETHGHEFDYPIPEAWRYRDAVIDQWNQDIPYDQIVREHLAGDLLDEPRRDPDGMNISILATGFWGLSQGTHGPVDVRMDQAERTDNQIDVFSKAFLGITVSCARCHDHKFDRILAADYAALSGFLRSSRRALVPLDPRGEIAAARKQITAAQKQLAPVLHSRFEVARRQGWAKAFLRGTELLEETHREREAKRRPDRVLFDFEGDSFGDWQVEGEAFGDRPHRLSELILKQAEGAVGSGVANSHDRRPGSDSAGSDRRVGSLTSPPFTIDRAGLTFQIGGGKHPDQTGVELRVDDEVVLHETGHNDTAMRSVDWDLTKWQGREARLVIFDRATGGWGHISADHFVLADAPVSPIPDRETSDREARRLSIAAAPFGELLRALATEDEADFFPEPSLDESDISFATFDGDDASRWFESGSFSSEPVAAATITTDGERYRRTPSGMVDSGRWGGEFEGTLRSETFVIERDWIHLRVRGRGQIRVIIDDYYLDTENALLFEGMAQRIDGDRWEHRRHSVSRYRGHRAYLEWNDDGPGSLAIDRVWFSDRENFGAPRSRRVAPIADDGSTLDTWEWFERSPEVVEWLLDAGVPLFGQLSSPGGDGRAFAQILAARKSVPKPVRALALVDGSEVDEAVFLRGDPHQRGDVIPRRLVQSLLPEQATITNGSGRLELADRVLDPRNPLTDRVMVNRVWSWLFGRGIVATPDDFGALGSRPTHPLLLDHLASRLREDRSLKRLIGSIVLSATYLQGGQNPDPTLDVRDPRNELLHRRPARRLRAEEVRDAMLRVSGRLDPTPGGVSVPIELTEFLTGRGRPAKSGPTDGAGRRSVYLEVRRNFLSPFLSCFDAPVPFSTTGKRNVSNVPAQSLARMNDPFVHGQAEVWVERILTSDLSGDAARVSRMVEEAYGRAATQLERERLLQFLGENPDRARWKDLAHALLSTMEFIFLE